MKVWFVSRHEGALKWAEQQGLLQGQPVEMVDSITAEQVGLDDRVIGSLPVHLVADICARGAHYLHISMQVPAERRGTELSAAEMTEFQARLREFLVLPAGDEMGAGAIRTERAVPGQGVQVCLVSQQYQANLLPVLKRRPQHVELMFTPRMKKAERVLLKALERFGYDKKRVTATEIPDSVSTDYHEARRVARACRERLRAKYPGQNVTLNATGGTKIMSSAFQLEFHGAEVIYTDAEHRPMCIRSMGVHVQEPEPLGSQFIQLRDYFYCQDFTVVAIASERTDYASTAAGRAASSRFLAEYRGHALSKLNTAASNIRKDVLGRDQGKHLSDKEKAARLNPVLPKRCLAMLKDKDVTFCTSLLAAGFLVRTADGGYAFKDYDAMKYLTGGWIEEWAWTVAKRCGADLVAAGVEIRGLTGQALGTETDNELDLVVLHDNRLLIAECKTIEWTGAAGKQEIFNKLDALTTHARGLFGKSLLVSAKPLDPKAARRAERYGIKVIAAHSLPDLEKEIKDWMGPLPRAGA